MKKIILILLCISSIAKAQSELFVDNPYQAEFNAAYTAYPSVPKGLLEAVAFSQTRFHQLSENDQNSCIGMPKSLGIMGLCENGQNYFRENLGKIAQLSGISTQQIKSSPAQSIMAYAAAYSNLLSSKKIKSNQPEDQVTALVELSELPLDNDLMNNYALNSQLYQVYWFLNQEQAQYKYHFPKYQLDLERVFGAQNLAVLSSTYVSATQNNISSSKGIFTPNIPYSTDYGPALWNAAATCNYSSRNGTAVSAITIHDVEGTYSGCISWFKNCNASVSAHYVLRSSDGQVTQMVLESGKAWHVGTENPYTIGFEHEGYRNQDGWYTVAMYTSSADLARDIVNSGYGINPLRAYNGPGCNDICTLGSCIKVKGHQHYPNQNHNDPGPKWNWYYYYNLINNNPAITTITATSGNLYDSGGASGSYDDDERTVTLIKPSGATNITLTFTAFDLETNWDYLFIYDGETTSAPLIGRYTGTTLPGTITSSGGALLLDFRSDCATIKTGYALSYNSVTTGPVQDQTAPTNSVDFSQTWATQNFTSSFSEQDNAGGSGLEKTYYQVLDYNGTEWRANNNNGFFSDNFDSIIHPDWTSQTGTWEITNGYLQQSDTLQTNSNIYAYCQQDLSNRYIYNWAQKFGGVNYTGANRRAGLYFGVDQPTLSQRGNGYFVWFRLDNDKIQLYRVENDSWGASFTYESDFAFNPEQWYDVKLIHDRITGKIDVYIDNALVSSWTDPTPVASGNYISFRSANCEYRVNNLKIYRSKYANTDYIISVGSQATNDIRYQSPNQTTAAGRVKTLAVDSAGNISSVASKDVFVDWTPPTTIDVVNDGLSNDIQFITDAGTLSGNWNAATDPNSGVVKYYYSIGTTAGGTDVVDWTDNWFNTSFSETNLNLTGNITYYVNVKSVNGAGLESAISSSNGQTLKVDNIAPETSILNENSWHEIWVAAKYTDNDNTGGSGLNKSFHHVGEYTGTEWRANGNVGFIKDNFTGNTIHSDWTNLSGTWNVENGVLVNIDSLNANTNIYADLNQNLSSTYLYHWKGRLNSGGTNRRAGFHFYCDAPDSTQRGNSYFVWFRLDNDKIQLYKVIENSWGSSYVKDTTYNFNAYQWYDFKVLYDKSSGVIQVYVNNKLSLRWKDLTPIQSGNSVSFRSGNCVYEVDSFEVYQEREANSNLNYAIGNNANSYIRFQNPNPSTPSGVIQSLQLDSAYNFSTAFSTYRNIDWTPPEICYTFDGLTGERDTTNQQDTLAFRWTKSSDPNSGLVEYIYWVNDDQGIFISYTSNGMDTSVVLTGLNLEDHTTYYACAMAYNNAGRVGPNSCSDGQYTDMFVFVLNQGKIDFVCYPNPTNGILKLKSGSTEIKAIEILDITGKVVLQKSTNSFELNLDLKKENIATGTYTVKAITQNEIYTSKIQVIE